MGKIFNFFAQFDAYGASPTLRARNHKISSSLVSGAISFILFLVFTYVFILKTYEVFNYKDITSVQTDWKLPANQTIDQQVLFGINVGHLTPSVFEQYFQIRVGLFQGSNLIREQIMSPCRQQKWDKLTQQQFLYNRMEIYYCPRTQLMLQKTFNCPDSIYVLIMINQCTQKVGSSCLPKADRDLFYSSKPVFFTNIAYQEEKVRLNQKTPISKSIGSGVQFGFSFDRGIIGTVQVGSFNVKTDYGVWPLPEQLQQKGNYISDHRYTSYTKNQLISTFALIYLNMERQYINIERKVGKIDEMLSYAGGLFSIVIGFFGFFFTSYNQYRYQLMVAEGVFMEDKKGNKVREKDFTFWKYIKYSIYDWISVVFCCQPDWKDCRAFQRAIEQANYRLDVTGLFKYMQVFNSQLNFLMDKSEKDCLALVKPQRLQKVKRNRLILQYYDKIIKDRQKQLSYTIEQYCIKKMSSKKKVKFCVSQNQNFQAQVSKLGCIIENSTAKIDQIMYNKNLKTKDELIELIFSQFKQLEETDELIQLDQQEDKIQRELSKQFYNLKPQTRQKIQQKIPLLILYRLKKRYDNGYSQSQVSNFTFSHASVPKIFIECPKTLKIITSNHQIQLKKQASAQ